MHLKPLTPLLLLLAATSAPPVTAHDLVPRGLPGPPPAEYPPAKSKVVAAAGGKLLSDDPAPAAITKSGTADAPVDGLDGKPHSGPGLYPETSGPKGSGEVGVSGGGASVDIKKPPPHTGEHEIVDIQDPAEGDDSLVGSTLCELLGGLLLIFWAVDTAIPQGRRQGGCWWWLLFTPGS